MVIRGPKQEADKRELFSKRFRLKKEFSGFSPDVLIGSFGYPFVNVGALSTEDKKTISSPKKYLKENNLDIKKIVADRQSLVNSKLVVPVKKINARFVEQTQEIAKSQKILDTEVTLSKPLSFNPSFHNLSLPHGPSAELKKLEITSSSTIKPFVERLTSDTDVRASEALLELNNKFVDEYKLTQLLSTGSLGKDRKLVPTKWSITAVDDTLGKHLHDLILDFDSIDFSLFQGEFLGNVFIVMFMPGSWSFELLEMTPPNTIHNSSNELIISHDFEYSNSRKKYVEETEGAFYASRLAVLEFLKTIRRQGSVIVFRVITERYTAPLGVWVVREGVRNALNNKLNDSFSSITEMLKKVSDLIAIEGVLDSKDVFLTSTLLKEKQLNLKQWL